MVAYMPYEHMGETLSIRQSSKALIFNIKANQTIYFFSLLFISQYNIALNHTRSNSLTVLTPKWLDTKKKGKSFVDWC